MSTRRARRHTITGHYAGPLSRLLAWIVDAMAIGFAFGLIVAAGTYFVGLVLDTSVTFDESNGLWWFLGLGLFAFLYFWISWSLTGRTPGMTLIGLRVVDRSGTPLTGRAALLRTIAFPFSFLIFGLGFVGIVVGRERRALHDVAAGSAVVYDWGDRSAELPSPLSNWIERRQSQLAESEEGSDAIAGG